MSRSPKYAQARLNEARRREIERQRRERDEQRRRAEEEARRQRLEARRAQVGAGVAGLEARLAAARQVAVAGGAPGLVEDAARGVAALRGQLDRASSERALGQAQRAVARCESAIAQLELRAAVAVEQRQRRQFLDVASAQRAAEPADASRFDPDGGRAVAGALAAMRRALEAQDHAAFDRARAEWAAAFARHRDLVAAGAAELAAARAQAEAVVAELAQAITRLIAERAAAGLERDPELALARVAERLTRDMRAERYAEVVDAEGEVRRLVDRRTAELDDWLDDRERVAAIVAAVTETLPTLGLRVDPASLREAGPDGTVHLRAERDGAAIQVAVVPDGRGSHDIVYDVQGFRFDQRREGDAVIHTCPTAEALLERLHAEMRQVGVEAGPLEWEGKPGRPDWNSARPTPRADQVRRADG